MSEVKLTKAQRGLAALIRAGMSERYISRADASRYDLIPEFEAALRGKLIQSAGYETSVAAEDWLHSAEGRAALEASHD